MSLRQSTAERVHIVLIDPTTGNRKTGRTVASGTITNDRAYLSKADGSTSSILLSDGVNWFEVDSTNSPGVYQLLLGVGDTNILGELAWTIQSNNASFTTASGSDTVSALVADVASVYSRIGAPVGASISADIAGVQSDTNDIQTRLPAALVGGRMDSSVGAVANDAITAAALAADAGTEIGNSVWASGTRTLTAATNITDTGGTTVVQTGDSYARLGAPAGASISADIAAVKSDTAAIKLKTDNIPIVPASQGDVAAVTSTILGASSKDNTEVIADLTIVINDARDNVKGGQDVASVYNRIGAPAGLSVSADIAGVQSDTNDIQSRLPAALVGGRIDAHAGSMGNDVVIAATVAADASAEIATAVWNHITRTLTAATNITSTGTPTFTQTGDSFARLGAPSGASVVADIAGVTSSVKGTQNISISDIAGGVGFTPATDTLDAIRTKLDTIQGAMPPQNAPSVWDEIRNAHVGAGTFGEAIRILYQVARGHIKIDKDNNQLVVYQENGTTPLFTCPLLRNGFPASIHADERLGG